ncbi:DoxX family protein [Pseudonocardia sp. KRD291]|uniref:DoxX family protein n=1 Tax=Pseudonocardia sp. KRD291 TaxID=2792007 RepID=UPI001C49DDBA|nr:DoxX family protein [Pseudonocardia sp. KRD291]MBW0106372.1 DoxX family protein [Pseudonocardia sp. KRD291]MDN5915327.1 DoxX family protein [Pseudonocardia sp.]
MNGSEVAQLVLRAVVGSTMIAHGVHHARTLSGTAGWFESIGFRRPREQAMASAVVEVGSGGALLLGAATPLAASAVVGTMAVAARAVHAENGFFITSEGYEYVVMVSAASLALGALGSGPVSVDRLLGVPDRMTGSTRAVLVLALGLGAAASQLAAFWRRPGPREAE